MNRYQQEVALMDRRHALLVRAATFLGSAVLLAAALWSSGLPRWLSALNEQHAAASPEIRQLPVEPTSADAAAHVANAVSGTDSSVAAVPQPLLLLSTAPGR